VLKTTKSPTVICRAFYAYMCCCLRVWRYRYEGSVVCFLGEYYFTVYQREKRMIFTDTDILARVVLSTSLSYDDVTGDSILAAEDLHTQSFGMRFSTVLGATYPFLVCHFILKLMLIKIQ